MGVFESFYSQILVEGPPDDGPGAARTATKNAIACTISSSCSARSVIRRSGPFYLGWAGVLSIAFGFVAFEIIGLNMAAQADWNPDPLRARVDLERH